MDFNWSTIGFRSAATLSMSSEESDLKSSAESHGENSKLLISSDGIISIGKGYSKERSPMPLKQRAVM